MEYVSGPFLTDELDKFLRIYKISMTEHPFTIKPKECELPTFELTGRSQGGYWIEVVVCKLLDKEGQGFDTRFLL